MQLPSRRIEWSAETGANQAGTQGRWPNQQAAVVPSGRAPKEVKQKLCYRLRWLFLCQEILCAQKWQTYITAYSKAPEGSKTADCCKVGAASCNHTKDCGNAQGEIECPLASKYVTPEPPEHGAKEQANVLCQCEKWRACRAELVGDGREYQGGHNGPEVV